MKNRRLPTFIGRALLAPAALCFSLIAAPAQVDFTWDSTVDGDWEDSSNWDPDTAFPDGQGLHVLLNDDNAFADADPGTRTITLSNEVTVGVLQLSVSNTQSFNVTGDGLLIFDNGTDAARIPVSMAGGGGDDSFLSVDVRLDTHKIEIPDRRLSISGAITVGTGFNPIVEIESDHLRLYGTSNLNAGRFLVDGGRLELQSATAAEGANSLIELTGGGRLHLLNAGDTNYDAHVTVSGEGGIFVAPGANQVHTITNVTVESTGTLTVNRNAQSGSRIFQISNNGTLRLEGGTLEAGRMNLTGAKLDIIRIASGSSLEGYGVISEDNSTATNQGRVRMLNGSTLSVGLDGDPGLLQLGSGDFGGNVSFATGSTIHFALKGTTPGTGYSQISVTGARSGIDTSDGDIDLSLELGYLYAPGDLVFLIVHDDNVTDLAGFNFFTGLDDGDTLNFTGGPFTGTARISYFGDFDANTVTGGFDVVLYDFAVIPEPSTVAAILGALALGLVAWRRARSER